MLTWPRRFERARRRVVLGVAWPGFCRADKRAAHGWNTCAVGEARNLRGYRVPAERMEGSRGDYMLPIDDDLQSLGHTFSEAVHKNDIDRAETTYYAVIKRCQELMPAIPAEFAADQVIAEAFSAAGQRDVERPN